VGGLRPICFYTSMTFGSIELTLPLPAALAFIPDF